MLERGSSLALLACLGLWGCGSSNAEVAEGEAADVAEEQEFSPYVTSDGTIRVPEDYRSEFVFLGTWSIAGDEPGGGAKELHTVYAQRTAVESYRRTGEFPDGTVLVKELFGTETGELTTGHVSRARQTTGWFVMVKDSQGRFPDNPLWGRGWGWSFFEAGSPDATVSTDYRTDCLGCHVPAQRTDWVYVEGYPTLNP